MPTESRPKLARLTKTPVPGNAISDASQHAKNFQRMSGVVDGYFDWFNQPEKDHMRRPTSFPSSESTCTQIYRIDSSDDLEVQSDISNVENACMQSPVRLTVSSRRVLGSLSPLMSDLLGTHGRRYPSRSLLSRFAYPSEDPLVTAMRLNPDEVAQTVSSDLQKLFPVVWSMTLSSNLAISLAAAYLVSLAASLSSKAEILDLLSQISPPCRAVSHLIRITCLPIRWDAAKLSILQFVSRLQMSHENGNCCDSAVTLTVAHSLIAYSARSTEQGRGIAMLIACRLVARSSNSGRCLSPGGPPEIVSAWNAWLDAMCCVMADVTHEDEVSIAMKEFVEMHAVVTGAFTSQRVADIVLVLIGRNLCFMRVIPPRALRVLRLLWGLHAFRKDFSELHADLGLVGDTRIVVDQVAADHAMNRLKLVARRYRGC